MMAWAPPSLMNSFTGSMILEAKRMNSSCWQPRPDLEALDLAEVEQLGQVHVRPFALPEAAVDEQGVGREADRQGVDEDEQGLEPGHEVVDAALEGRMVGVVHRGHLEGHAHGPGHGADELVLVGRDGDGRGRRRRRDSPDRASRARHRKTWLTSPSKTTLSHSPLPPVKLPCSGPVIQGVKSPPRRLIGRRSLGLFEALEPRGPLCYTAPKMEGRPTSFAEQLWPWRTGPSSRA